MKRIAKITVMLSLLMLGLLALASDSVNGSMLQNREAVLTYDGDLIISGNLEIYNEDGETLDFSKEDLTVKFRFLKENNFVYSKENYPFTLNGDHISLTLRSEDTKIIEETKETLFKVTVTIEYSRDGEKDTIYETIPYKFTPKK